MLALYFERRKVLRLYKFFTAAIYKINIFEEINVWIMMNDENQIIFELAKNSFELTEQADFEQIKLEIQSKVIWFLLNDLEKLWQILYQIDVNETDVKALFHQNEPKLIAPGITNLIIDRLRQKAKTRIEYRNK